MKVFYFILLNKRKKEIETDESKVDNDLGQETLRISKANINYIRYYL